MNSSLKKNETDIKGVKLSYKNKKQNSNRISTGAPSNRKT